MNQHFQLANIFSSQGLIKTIFNNSIPIFGMLIWMRPNSIKAKVKTTKKLFFFGLKKKQKKNKNKGHYCMYCLQHKAEEVC